MRKRGKTRQASRVNTIKSRTLLSWLDRRSRGLPNGPLRGGYWLGSMAPPGDFLGHAPPVRKQHEVYPLLVRARSGDIPAIRQLAKKYQFGLGIARNHRHAAYWYSVGVNLLDPDSGRRLVDLASNTHDEWILSGFDNLLSRLELGFSRFRTNAWAISRLIMLYQFVIEAMGSNSLACFTDLDLYRATVSSLILTPKCKGNFCQLLHRICKEDPHFAPARYLLRHARCPEMSHRQRRSLLVDEALQGYPESQFEVGFYFLNHERRPAQAFRWLMESANRDHAEAVCLLGQCFREGIGCARDEREAIRCFQRAAEAEDPEAQRYLSRCGHNPKLSAKWTARSSLQRCDGENRTPYRRPDMWLE